MQKKLGPAVVKQLKWAFKNPNSKVSMKILSVGLGEGFIIDDILKKQAEGKTALESFASPFFLDKAVHRGFKRSKATDQQNIAYDRHKLLTMYEKAKDGSAGMRSNLMSMMVNAAQKDPDFKGQPGEYIEWLKMIVDDPHQQKLIRERDIETEEALTIPKEVVDKRKQTFKNWRSIPTVDAIRQYFLLKNDPEQYEKEYPTLTGDTKIEANEGGIISLRR